MAARLRKLHRWLADVCGAPVRGKAYVDTGPVLERDLARRAGLGWFGKNSMLINPQRGSFFLLGALLVDVVLGEDSRFESDHCGTCRRCLDACPTGAIIDDGVVDARRCISYLTIELREGIPAELRPALGSLLFGCDICQDVCPWNRRFSRHRTDTELAPRPGCTDPDPIEVLQLGEADFRERYSGTAIMRAKRRGLARNAAVVLGNRADPSDVPALAQALTDPEPMVRGHAAWALGRIGTEAAFELLQRHLIVELDAGVLEEVRAALNKRR
jgi:epoxyqueuosine reductase